VRPPPVGVLFRPPTLADADGVAALIAARDASDFGEEHALTGEELRSWWRPDAERLATDAWIAVRDGQAVGFLRMERDGDIGIVEDEACVHPEARRQGLGAHLLDLAEDWARRRELHRVQASVVDDSGRRLLELRGYLLVRHFWRMEIVLTAEPTMPEPPPALAIRPYRPGEDDRPLHAAHQDAFRELWEFAAVPLDDWLRSRHEREDYHPELWQLAVEGDEIAGAALCFGADGFGWVLDLFVGARWRGRGLGLSLLVTGFRELQRHGFPRVGLEVDAANPTGATRLYERAGMRVSRRYDTYEKRLEG
jgi:mycothiol synthase